MATIEFLFTRVGKPCGVSGWWQQRRDDIGVFRPLIVTKYKKNVSCEIEDFVGTQLSKPCMGYFDRAYYVRVLCDLTKNVSPY